MTDFYDPRAELDYSQFAEVGEFEVAPIIPKGVFADPVGTFPRDRNSFSPGELERFEDTRARLDRVLQVTGIRPLTPQENISPVAYEAGLLRALAKHTSGRLARMSWSPQETSDGVIATCTKYNVVADALGEPARQGRLAEIRTTDATGRVITEYVGDKSQWLGQFKSPAFVSAVHLDGQPQRV